MKPRYKSKTYWFNCAILALAVLETQSSVFGSWSPYVLLGSSLANIFLRELTKQPVG